MNDNHTAPANIWYHKAEQNTRLCGGQLHFSITPFNYILQFHFVLILEPSVCRNGLLWHNGTCGRLHLYGLSKRSRPTLPNMRTWKNEYLCMKNILLTWILSVLYNYQREKDIFSIYMHERSSKRSRHFTLIFRINAFSETAFKFIVGICLIVLSCPIQR